MQEPKAVFGFPDKWTGVYKSYEDVFLSIDHLTKIANELIAATQDGQKPVQEVLRDLAQVNLVSMNDVLVLVGNDRGTGAMKVARSMFEVSITAEYLEKNPQETQDYLDFGFVIAWRWLQKIPDDKLAAEQAKQAEVEYNRVVTRFTNSKGQVRNNWTLKSLKQMANDIGRSDLYEVVYSAASALHHVNVIGLLSHELDWSAEALRVAEGGLLQTICSLYDVSDIGGFTDRLNALALEFDVIWKRHDLDRAIGHAESASNH